MLECLWRFGCRVDHRRHGGTDRDHTGGQEDDDEHDDQHDDDYGHNQLDILPPVGAGHLLRRLLEVLRLQTQKWSHDSGQEDRVILAFTLFKGRRDGWFWNIPVCGMCVCANQHNLIYLVYRV